MDFGFSFVWAGAKTKTLFPSNSMFSFRIFFSLLFSIFFCLCHTIFFFEILLEHLNIECGASFKNFEIKTFCWTANKLIDERNDNNSSFVHTHTFSLALTLSLAIYLLVHFCAYACLCVCIRDMCVWIFCDLYKSFEMNLMVKITAPIRTTAQLDGIFLTNFSTNMKYNLLKFNFF